MEITVLEASNTPPKAVLAVHAGSVRRQARLEVNQPFVIPHTGPLQAGKVDVTLFQQIASHRMQDDGLATCTIPVRKPDGSSSEVKLRVIRQVEQGGGAQKTAPSEGATKSYLDNHRLQQRIQTMIQEVLKEQPDDPYKYMLEQLKKCRAEGPDKDGASAPERQAELQLVPPPLPEARSQPSAGPPDVPKQAPPSSSPTEGPAKATAPLAPAPPTAPKPPSGGPERPGGSPNRPGRKLNKKDDGSQKTKSTKNAARLCSNPPRTEFQKEARATMQMILRSAPCKLAMLDSQREQAQKTAAKEMTAAILNSAKDRVVREMVRGTALKDITRAVINEALCGSAILLSSQYQRALTRYTAVMAFRGAAKIMRGEAGLLDWNRRMSLPTPIINLGGACDWGASLAR